jgi:TPR repeat protein
VTTRTHLQLGLLVGLLFAAVNPCAAQSTVEDPASYKEFYTRALNGDASAMNEVGVALAEGTGVESDQRKAVVWFRRAAELGDAHGAGNLGLHYFNGQGIRRDKILAAKWFMICHALDALRCHPSEFVDQLKLTPRQLAVARRAALEWLRARPDLKNNHGDRPWFGEGEYPTVFRF